MDTRSAKSALKKLLTLLKTNHVPTKEILIFGSHAKGQATKQSDLDVCLIFSDKIKNADTMVAHLRFRLGQLNLNIDLSSLYQTELKTNRLSSFIHEIKTSSMPVEKFLKHTPKNIDRS